MNHNHEYDSLRVMTNSLILIVNVNDSISITVMKKRSSIIMHYDARDIDSVELLHCNI